MLQNAVVSRALSTTLCAIGLSVPVSARALEATGAHSTAPIFGYLDPATRVFTPAPDAPKAEAREATTPVVRTGTLIVTVNVAFIPSFPAGGSASARVSATNVPPATAEPVYTTDFQGSAPVVRAGATGVATVTIPYAVTVSSPTDPISLETTLSASNGESAVLKQTIPLPAQGATTRLSVNQRL